jgi:thiol-disulfide isomerase/thioredoxin
MKSVMKMMKKINTRQLIVVLMVTLLLFGCKCAFKSMNVEAFEEVTGFDGSRMVVNLASWCGHCKSFKASGEIEKLKELDLPVEVNEDDDAANKKYGVKGFPSIMKVSEDGNQVPFKGPRTADAIEKFFNSN